MSLNISIEALTWMSRTWRLRSAGLFAVSLVALSCTRRSETPAVEPQHFTIHVESVPAETPFGAPVYVAGNFNRWNPRDAAYQLASDNHGGYVISFPDSVKGPIAFKFTLGSWDSAETDSSGADIPNRTAVAGPNRGVYVARVAGWRHSKKRITTSPMPD